MALIIDILAAGTLATGIPAPGNKLYGPSSNKGALVTSIILQNTSASEQRIVHLKMRPGPPTTSYYDKYIAPVSLIIPPKGEFILEAEFTLSNSGSTQNEIVGWVNVVTEGSDVNYIINGLEKNQD